MVPSGERRAVCYDSNGVDVWFDGSALSHRRDTPTTTSRGQRRAACRKNTVAAAWFDSGALPWCGDTAATNLAERKKPGVTRALVQLRGLTVVWCGVAEIQLPVDAWGHDGSWWREKTRVLQEHGAALQSRVTCF